MGAELLRVSKVIDGPRRFAVLAVVDAADLVAPVLDLSASGG